jgi:putative ABC transport system permease protein
MACCATIIAVGMSIYLLPLLNQIAHKDIHFTAILSWHFLLLITLVLSLVALLSGSYPALYLSSKNVITSLRGHFTSTPGGLRNFLLAFQFMICIALIACTRIVFDQMKLLTQTHPGFDKEQVLVVDIPYDPTLWANMKAIKNVMKELPEVKSVSLIGNNSMPTSDLDIDTYDVYEEGEWKTKALNNISVDEEFLSLLGVPIIQGRNFRQEDFVNEESVAIVNASMVKTMHWEDPLTEKIFNGDAALKIVGVVNDFHFHGFHKQVEPIIIQLDNQYPEKLLIKVTRSDFNTIVKIEDTWKKMVKDHPFEFDFLDNFFNDQYHSERTMQTLLSYFSILTLVVASLGLFGLLAILTAQRTKEFGIRKVFGANLAHLLLLLCKPFIILLLAGTALAIPLTIYFMQLWLQRFSTQITIGATPFLIASFTAMLLILLCMLYHAIHSYRSKTLHALRYE